MGNLNKYSASLLAGQIDPYAGEEPLQVKGNAFHSVVAMYIAAAALQMQYDDSYFKDLERKLNDEPDRMNPIVQQLYRDKKHQLQPEVAKKFEFLIRKYAPVTDTTFNAPQNYDKVRDTLEHSILRKYMTDIKASDPRAMEHKLTHLSDLLGVAPGSWDMLTGMFDDPSLTWVAKKHTNASAEVFFNTVRKQIMVGLDRGRFPEIDLGNLISYTMKQGGMNNA